MAERAHPNDEAFADKVEIERLFGIIPVKRVIRNPYREALEWRYHWASGYCKNRSVLDIPCGMGWGTSMICGAARILGVDIDDASIREAKARYGDHAEFVVGRMDALPSGDREFDRVLCLEGIEHVAEAVGREFIKEAKRVLAPNGLLLLSSPFCADGHHSGNEFHIKEYQPHEIIELLRPDFTVDEVVERQVDNLTVQYLACRPNWHD